MHDEYCHLLVYFPLVSMWVVPFRSHWCLQINLCHAEKPIHLESVHVYSLGCTCTVEKGLSKHLAHYNLIISLYTKTWCFHLSCEGAVIFAIPPHSLKQFNLLSCW